MMTWSDRLLAGTMLLGIYVNVEPAPFDVAIAGLGLVLLARGRLSFPGGARIPMVLLTGFGIANLLSLAVMRHPEVGFSFAGITAYLVAFWVLVVAALGRGRTSTLDAVLWGYAVSGAVVGAVGIATFLGLPGLKPVLAPTGRFVALFKDPNVCGAYLVPAAAIALAALIGRQTRRRLLCVAAIAVCAGGAFLSFSRAAWINLGVTFGVFFVLFSFANALSRTWWRTVLFFPLVVVLLSLHAYQLASVPDVHDMFALRFGMQSYDAARFATQSHALHTAVHNPLGLGPGSTEGAFSLAAHSTYVRALVENGVLGALSLFAFMVVSCGRAMWYAVVSRQTLDRLRFAVVTAVLCGMYVEAAVIDTVHWRHFWLFLALAWCPAPATVRRSARPAT